MSEDGVDKKESTTNTNTVDLVCSGFERVGRMAFGCRDKLSCINHNVWLVNLAQRYVTYSSLLSPDYIKINGDHQPLIYNPVFYREFAPILNGVGVPDGESWVLLLRETNFETINSEIISGDFGTDPLGKVLRAVYVRAEQAYNDLDRQVVFYREPVLGQEIKDGQHQLVGDIASFLGQYVFVHQKVEAFNRRVEDFGVVRYDPHSVYADAYGLAPKVKKSRLSLYSPNFVTLYE